MGDHLICKTGHKENSKTYDSKQKFKTTISFQREIIITVLVRCYCAKSCVWRTNKPKKWDW